MAELKPCPFCGENENIDYRMNNGTIKGFDYVICQSCGAEVHALHKDKQCNAAIEAWNGGLTNEM